jgi:hypothetical protein
MFGKKRKENGNEEGLGPKGRGLYFLFFLKKKDEKNV